jgi:hypothetical protein
MSAINEIFLGRAEEGKLQELADLSDKYVEERLEALTPKKPKVACVFERLMELCIWRFTIDWGDGLEKQGVYIEVSDKELLTYDHPVTYFLEKRLKRALSL